MGVTFLIMVLIALMSTMVNDYSAKSVRLGKSLSADSPCYNFPPFPRCGIVSRPCHSFAAFISEASRPGERALSQNSVFLANRRWPVEVRVCVCKTRKRNATHQVGSPQVVRERQSSLSRRSVSSATVDSATAPVRQSLKTASVFHNGPAM